MLFSSHRVASAMDDVLRRVQDNIKDVSSRLVYEGSCKQFMINVNVLARLERKIDKFPKGKSREFF